MADEYFNIGDEKTIALNSTSTASLNTLADTGETYTLQIIGFNHDDLVDEDGNLTGKKAGITFQFKEIIEKSIVNNSTSYPYGDSRGGWEVFKIRTRLNDTIYNSLPNELQNKIKSVNKICDNGYGNKTLNNTMDKLFLLSFDEVGIWDFYDDCSANYLVSGQGEIYEYYESITTSQRVKYYNDETFHWALRSSYYNHIHHIGIVTNWGGKIGGGANGPGYLKGISPAFCI